jgi:hypothetical protein
MPTANKGDVIDNELAMRLVKTFAVEIRDMDVLQNALSR